MRGLKVLVVAMGVLIVVGTATLGVLIIRRVGGTPVAGPSSAGLAGGRLDGARTDSVAALTLLDEPVGTRIALAFALGDRLVLQLQGGGPDRVLLIDPRSGAIAGRIGLVH